MNNQMKQFSLQLDQLLGIHVEQINTVFTNPQDETALEIGSLLKGMDFDSELAPKSSIRSHWVSQTQAITPPTRRLITVRTAWLAALVLALALLIAFRQPVLAAVSNLFGYVYFQDVGFLPADSTRVLQQPIRQEHAGQSLIVIRGIATQSETIIWLEYSDSARPADGAKLTTSTGSRLEVSHWEYSPNLPDTHGVVMHFPSLPPGTTQTTLSLPEGWQIPLEWIPASQSHLPDVRAVPYPATVAPETPALSAVTPEQELCQEKHGMKLCVLAATATTNQAGTVTTSENTSVLVQTHSLLPALSEKVWFGAIWRKGVTLKDAKGNVFPLNSYQNGTLLFPPISANQTVSLTVPAVLASLDVSRQSITVDLGSDPQPNNIIPLDVTIPVLGTSVHFSKATFIGDGVSSLRLTLDADPVQTVDGITPVSIEIGKPDQVDDLYGVGMLEGSKDIFIELIRPTGKVTGILNIPLDKAIVTVQGPFELSFNLPEAASISPAPALADPNTFSPAPTATPIPLDAYVFSGQSLLPGDLLYTVLDDDNTNVYIFPAGTSGLKETQGAKQSRLLVILPGAVSQIYLHPDRQGLDYLAGTHEFRDGFSYIDHIRLYTLRFADQRPYLLHNFPANQQNLVGTTVEGSWSFDGHYAIFRYSKPLPGEGDYPWKFLWMDMTCSNGKLCMPHEVVPSTNLGLYEANFAPTDYRILFTGENYSGPGDSSLFIMDFNPSSEKNDMVKITTRGPILSVGADERTLWAADGSIFSLCSDGQALTMFCSVNPGTGEIVSSAPYTEHITDYQLTSSGKQVLAVVINHTAPGKGLEEIHLFEMDGRAGPALATERMFNILEMSPSEQSIAYVPETEDRLNMIDLNSGLVTLIQKSSEQWVISWVGWVR
jgi:hypothetical protein